MIEGHTMVHGMGHRERRYVEVVVRFGLTGSCEPVKIILDGRSYPIDRTLEARRISDPKRAGTHLTRYTIIVKGKMTHVWRDEIGWYVEKIIRDDADPA